ncbi:hypothetical protein [Shewanella woodyi]|uniref:hypothetical protein n=1 Tax=Shewanella woodyi TaxID=60961 RepID=UPI0037493F2E
MLRTCKGCGHNRTESDVEFPEWQCPGCGYAYNKIEKKLANEKVAGEPECTSSRASSKAKPKYFRFSYFIILFLCGLSLFMLRQLIDLTKESEKLDYQSIGSTETLQPAAEVVTIKKIEDDISNADKQSIENAIERVDSRISLLDIEIAKYSGGLILSTLRHSLAIEKQTLSMLKQKQSSWLYGVDLDYTIDGKSLELPASKEQTLAPVIQEIRQLEKDIEKSKAEADKYIGGSVLATLLSTNATQQQTLAMLQQKKISLIYALPQYIGFDVSRSRQPSALSAKEPESRQWKIVSIDAKVTEKNSSWWRFSWKLEIQNNEDNPLAFSGKVEFLDSDGFVVDEDTVNRIVVSSGESKMFTGYALVTTSTARTVNSTSARVSID